MNHLLPFLFPWLCGQLLFWLFIQAFVRQQQPVLTVFRNRVKPSESHFEDAMHTWNFCMAAWAGVLVSLLQLFWGAWYHAALMLFLLIPFFSRWYDRGINKQMGNDPNYLGAGAETDQRLTELFGLEAGRRKNRFCLILVVLFNAAGIVLQLWRMAANT